MNYNKSHNFLTLPIFVLVPISKKELIMSKIGGGEGKIKFGILFWQNTYQVQSMERD